MRGDEFTLHQDTHWQMHSMDITLEVQLEIVLGLFPVLQAIPETALGLDLDCKAPGAMLEGVVEAKGARCVLNGGRLCGLCGDYSEGHESKRQRVSNGRESWRRESY